MWLEALRFIRDELKLHNIADSIKLGGYNRSDVRPEDNASVFIMRGGEKNAGNGDTKLEVFIDIWIQSNDKLLETGYERLSAIEQHMDVILLGLNDKEEVATGLQLLELTIDEKIGDGDGRPPLVGVRYVLSLKVYDYRQF